MNTKEDILFHGIPAVWNKRENNFLVFSPYAEEVAVFPSEKVMREAKTILQKRNFFGKPCISRGNLKTIRLVLVVTNDCRLRCRYCFTRGGEKKDDMSIETALAAVEAGWKEKRETANSIEILFFGGEPTLKLDLIREVTKFIKDLPLEKTYLHMNTDGLLTEKELNWLIENGFFITISCDGPPKTQDYLRPTAQEGRSSPQVEETIKRLVALGMVFSIRATMTRYNSLPDLINYCADLGVKFVHFERVAVTGRANFSQVPLKEQYVKNFNKALKIAMQREVYLITSPLMNLFFPADHFCVQLAGKKYIIFPSGKIVLCYFNKGCGYEVGQVNVQRKELEFNGREKELKNIALPDDCAECAFKYLCAGGCPSENKTATGTFRRVDKEFCFINKAILHESIISLCEQGRKNGFSPVIGNELLQRLISKQGGMCHERSTNHN